MNRLLVDHLLRDGVLCAAMWVLFALLSCAAGHYASAAELAADAGIKTLAELELFGLSRRV